MVNYTDRAMVTAIRTTETPRSGQTVTGYGRKIPTRYMVRYAGRWHRVYAMSYGNAASVYIIVKGETLFLDNDTEHDLEGK